MDTAAWIKLIESIVSEAPTLINDANNLWQTVKQFYSPTDQATVDAELAKARKDADKATADADVALDEAAKH